MNKQEMLKHWTLAETAYGSLQEIKSKHLDAMIFGNPDRGDMCYVIPGDGNSAYVVFRGSNDFKDWLLNFWFGTSRQGVHKGFWYGLDGIYDDIVEHLKKLSPSKVYIVGHSRGGGLGEVFARRISRQHAYSFAHDITGVLFGSPRVSRKRFIRDYPVNGKLNYVDNGADIVCKMPPSWAAQFHRDGNHIIIGDKPSKRETLQQIALAFATKRTSYIELVNDHVTYRKAIEALPYE